MLLEIEALDGEGRGVARADGKVVFVEGALPGELVEARLFKRRKRFDLAAMARIIRASPYRTTPPCPHFGVCGGCSLQHLDVAAQVANKQRMFEDALARIGKLRPDRILPPVMGPTWAYRHRARFSVRYVQSKNGVLVGFHERKSSFIADIRSCRVVPPAVSKLLPALHALIDALSLRDRIPQVELAVGEAAIALVFRVLQAPEAEDLAKLRAFAADHGIQVYLQPKGPETATPLDSTAPATLGYRLPEFDLHMAFRPTDFTQVNHAVNEVLVRRAIGLLAPQPGERIGDLFCGLGNFTLAIARRGARVLGIDGSAALLSRAADNARHNGLHERVEYRAADLFKTDAAQLAAWGRFDRLLIDPPRDGAIEIVKALGAEAPARIVYVSCNPATLARDAAVLVTTKGYTLREAGVLNMFPHTAHVESIAVFDLKAA